MLLEVEKIMKNVKFLPKNEFSEPGEFLLILNGLPDFTQYKHFTCGLMIENSIKFTWKLSNLCHFQFF